MPKLTINGTARAIAEPPDRPLLLALREELELTGAKYGCGEGQCGACTVVLDGKAVRSCLTPLRALEGKTLTTVEGLAPTGQLHPVQRAFLEAGAFQCGYCTPGMIMAAVALLARNPDPSEADVARGLQGNVCRCGMYSRIVAAVRRASVLAREGTP